MSDTKELMKIRLAEVTTEIDQRLADMKSLNDEYNRLATGPVRDEARKAEVVAAQKAMEAPIIELRKEQSALAKALGGRSMADVP